MQLFQLSSAKRMGRLVGQARYACWCEKTTERTTAAIAEAKALIEDRSTYILEVTLPCSESLFF